MSDKCIFPLCNEGGYYYDLFKFFNDEHNLILVDTEIQDIIHAVDQFKRKNKVQQIFNGK